MSSADQERGFWRRHPRLRRAVLVVLGLCVLGRASQSLWLEPVARRAARSAGVDLAWRELELSLWRGAFELRGLSVGVLSEEGEPTPLLDVDSVGGDLDMAKLLVGELAVTRASLGHVVVELERDAAGSWNFDRLGASGGDAETPPDAEDRPDEGPTTSLALPLSIERLALGSLELHVRDATCDLDQRASLSFEARRIGLPDEGGELELNLRAPGLLGALHVEGTLAAGTEALDASLRLGASDLRPERVAELLGALGIPGVEAAAREVDAGLEVAVGARLEQGEVRWSAGASELFLEADGVREVALGSASVELDGGGIGRVELGDGLVRARRSRAGELELAGLRLVSGGGTEATPDVPDADAGVDPPGAGAPLGFGPVVAHGLRVEWRDEDALLAAPVEVAVELGSLELGRLEVGGGPASVAAELFAPGVFASAILGGELALGSTSHAKLKLALEGLVPKALEGYLAAAGIESQLGAGRLTASLGAVVETRPDGVLRVDADLTELELADGEKLLGVEGVLVRDLLIGGTGVEVARVEVVRPAARVVRRADGSIEVAGLALLPPGSTGAASEGAPEGDALPGGPLAVPELRVGHLSVTDTELSLRDETVEPALSLLPDELELDLAGLVIARGSRETATLRLKLAQSGLAESLGVELAVTPVLAPSGLQLGLRGQVAGAGLSSGLVREYLEAAGVGGELVGGRLALGLSGALELLEDGQLEGEVGVAGLDFGDATRTWAALGRVELPLHVADDKLSVGPVVIEGPQLALERGEDGALGFAGLRLGAGGEAAAQDRAPEGASSAAERARAEPKQPGPELAFGGLSLGGGELVFLDRLGSESGETVEQRASFRLEAGPIAAGQSADLRLELEAPGLVDSLGTEASLTFTGAASTVVGQLRLRGLRGDAVSRYLPERTRLEPKDGRLDLGYKASFAAGADGGPAAVAAEVTDLMLADGEEALLGLSRAALNVPRLGSEVVDIEELSVSGLELDVERGTAGALHVAGVVLEPGRAEESRGAPAAEAEASGSGPAAAPKKPYLGLGKLRVELTRLGFADQLEGGAPLELSFVLENRAPWSVDLAAEEEEPAALALDLHGAALPVAGSVGLSLELDPFRSEPHLELGLDVGGLSGTGLAAVLPSLAERLDAAAMEGGRFGGRLGADLSVTRRGPLAVDLSRGVTGELELTDVGFAPTEGGPVKLGFASLAAELRSASARGVELGSLELTDPVGRVEVVPGGLSVAGLVLSSAESEAASSPASETPSAEPPGQAAAPPAFALTIDEVYASGLDFVFRDLTADPPVVLPLADLDLSLKGLSTRALYEPLPVSFELFVGAGDVELPERKVAANMLTGFLSAAASAVAGDADEFKLEERPAFGGLDAAGRLTLAPKPKGWVSMSLAGLELRSFRGAARSGGVDLGDGLLDLDLDVRLLGERGAAVSSRARAAYLSLSEPPGGPISSYLKLPAPLDTVLFLLRNEDDEVVLPLDLKVAPDGGLEGLGTEVTKTIGLVVGEAIASSPMRLVGGVLDMTGLTKEEPVVLPEEPPGLSFLGASVELEPGTSLESELGEVFELMRRDPKLKLDLVHSFGERDLVGLRERANPAPELARALSVRLGIERDLLLAERERRTSELVAHFAAGDAAGIQTGRDELLELNAELAAVEESLDGVLTLLRPGAERRAQRRTKLAALLLAEERLAAVKAAILAQPIESIGKRVRVRRARWSEPMGEQGRVLAAPH